VSLFRFIPAVVPYTRNLLFAIRTIDCIVHYHTKLYDFPPVSISRCLPTARRPAPRAQLQGGRQNATRGLFGTRDFLTFGDEREMIRCVGLMMSVVLISDSSP